MKHWLSESKQRHLDQDLSQCSRQSAAFLARLWIIAKAGHPFKAVILRRPTLLLPTQKHSLSLICEIIGCCLLLLSLLLFLLISSADLCILMLVLLFFVEFFISVLIEICLMIIACLELFAFDFLLGKFFIAAFAQFCFTRSFLYLILIVENFSGLEASNSF